MRIYFLQGILIALILLIAGEFSFVSAQNKVEDLRAQITNHSAQIQKLEAEIREQEAKLLEVGAEKETLQKTINELNLTRKKLQTDINLTEAKIARAQNEISRLETNINEHERSLEGSMQALSKSIRIMQRQEDVSLIEKFLSHNTVSGFVEEIDQLKQFNRGITQFADDIRLIKSQLALAINVHEESKDELLDYKGELSGQQSAVLTTKKEKDQLLARTKGEEAEYQRILKEKQAQKEAFEKELFEFESQLQYEIDPESFATGKPGILAWPLTDIYVTQLFGQTGSSGRLYKYGSHNGVDFRAPIGTKLYAPLSGVVAGVGNTAAAPRTSCVSYGKWIMIRHENGLTTVYMHLSEILVAKGQEVKTGDVIGLTGNTGYSTGPHLHLGLYVSQGIKIDTYRSKTACNGNVMPLASRDAYLDPLDYLPEVSPTKISPFAR